MITDFLFWGLVFLLAYGIAWNSASRRAEEIQGATGENPGSSVVHKVALTVAVLFVSILFAVYWFFRLVIWLLG